jgi:hypothetical protein
VSACPVRVPQRDGCPLWADDDSVSTRARWRVCFLLVPPDPPHTNFPDWVTYPSIWYPAAAGYAATTGRRRCSGATLASVLSVRWGLAAG